MLGLEPQEFVWRLGLLGPGILTGWGSGSRKATRETGSMRSPCFWGRVLGWISGVQPGTGEVRGLDHGSLFGAGESLVSGFLRAGLEASLSDLFGRLGPQGPARCWDGLGVWFCRSLFGTCGFCCQFDTDGSGRWVLGSLPRGWGSGGWLDTGLGLVPRSTVKSGIHLTIFPQLGECCFLCCIARTWGKGDRSNMKLFTTLFSASFLISVFYPGSSIPYL